VERVEKTVLEKNVVGTSEISKDAGTKGKVGSADVLFLIIVNVATKINYISKGKRKVSEKEDVVEEQSVASKKVRSFYDVGVVVCQTCLGV